MKKQILLFCLAVGLLGVGVHDARAASCPSTCQEAVETVDEACSCGETGLVRKQRTTNVSSVCGANGAWSEVSNNCAAVTEQRDNPVQTRWVQISNMGNLNSAPLPNNCPSGWTGTEIIDDQDGSRHHVGEEESHSQVAQLCIRTSDEAVAITSQWAAGTCPAGTVDTGIRDDGGNASDPPYSHALNEETSRGAYLYWHWCLGVPSPSTLTTRWVSTSGKSSPPCAAGETGLIEARSGKRDFNSDDYQGKNQERLCVKVTTPVSSACPAAGNNDPLPLCGSGIYTCQVGTTGNQEDSGTVYSWTCTSGSEVRNCSQSSGGGGGGGGCSGCQLD